MLARSAPLAYVMAGLCASTLAFIQQGQVASLAIGIWLFALLLIYGIRASFHVIYVQTGRGNRDARYWLRVQVCGAAASGLIWGLAAILLFPPQSAVHQVFVAFVLAGMSAGGVTVLAPRLEAALLFLLPTLLPLIVQFALQDADLALAMAGLCTLFLLGMSFVAVNVHRSVTRALRLNVEKQRLLQRVSADKAGTDALNDRLLKEIAERQGVELALREARDTLEQRVRDRTAELEEQITERQAYEEQLKYLAHYDSLTGSASRVVLQDRLHQAIVRAQRQKHQVSVLFVDLDRFKLINDSLGHGAGDSLLRLAAERLRDCIREGDTVARPGGDEFVLVLEGKDLAEGALVVARKVLEAMRRPFRIEDQEFVVTCSIGVSLFPQNGTDPETLLKNANTAMHRAKENGRNDLRLYAAEMSSSASERLVLENALHKALGRQEFQLHYQPLVRLRDGAIVGFEALLRWHSPQLGDIPPADFIPLAEENGLIVPIGAWALRSACVEAKRWGPSAAGLPRVAVNLSSRQFFEAGLAELVERTLHDSTLDSSRLELEITESQLMKDVQGALDTLHTLKQLGVGVAVDDFGTGYSSLSYLKRFPIDRLTHLPPMNIR
jgi:diguanylate cyclase (GGDEF)-like protein